MARHGCRTKGATTSVLFGSRGGIEDKGQRTEDRRQETGDRYEFCCHSPLTNSRYLGRRDAYPTSYATGFNIRQTQMPPTICKPIDAARSQGPFG